MGCQHTGKVNVSERGLAVTPSPATLIGTIPASACEGQMLFQQGTGSTADIYIGLGGKTPTPQDYDIHLDANLLGVGLENIIPGDIRAIAATTGALLSMLATFNA